MSRLILLVAGALLWMLSLGVIFVRRYRRVRPGQALVVYGGRRGMRIVRERGSFVFPIIEEAAVLDLAERPLRLQVEGVNLAATDGGRKSVRLDVLVQYGLEPTEEALRRAAERFLHRSPGEIDQVVRALLEGHLRSALTGLTVQDLRLDPLSVTQRIHEESKEDLARMGVVVSSWVLQGIDE